MSEQGRIGVDESGKGDYFGPLVIAACYVGPVQEAVLQGVQDSKKLTDKAALSIAEEIKRVCPHTVIAILPPKYNELYEKIRNLNRLLEWGHAQAIENVFKEEPCRTVISDRFADPRGLVAKLKKKGLDVDLTSRVRAESDMAVAAASILARAEFLRRLEALGSVAGFALPKGAGSPVLAAGRRFVAEVGKDRLGEVAKLHFKTTQQVGG